MQLTEKKFESDLEPLFDFISSYQEMEGGKLFFKNLDDFFSNVWKESFFIVYSLSKETGEDKPLTRRLLWNRNKLNEFHPDVLNGYTDIDPMKGYYIFCLGEENLQQIFGVLKTNEKIKEKFWKYFNKFLATQEKRIKKLQKLKKLEHLIEIDSATGLYNQQKLFRDIKSLIRDYQKYREVFSILFIDIDHFKLVNEKYGHLVGSETLANLAKLLKTILRDNDLLYRYGGDEFVTIVKDITTGSVRNVADRILKGVQNHPFHTNARSFNREERTFHISVSIGVSIYPQDIAEGQDILVLADKRMYKAKDSGRGCVCGP